MRLALLWCLFIFAFGQSFGQLEGKIADSSYVVKGFIIEGNQKTKPRIILREVLFAKGDTLTAKDLRAACAQSRKNIFNTRLFNFVEVNPVLNENGNCFVQIKLQERWYFWPSPIFEYADPNFNTWWRTKDFSRLNWGIDLRKQNFRGRNEDLTVRLKFGYTQQFRLAYKIPYINKAQTIGLAFGAQYEEQQEITFGTINNERVFYSDGDKISRIQRTFSAEIIRRKNIFATHNAKITLVSANIADSLAFLNPQYFGNGRKHLSYFKFSYFFTLDQRDIRAYPLRGSYLQVNFEKRGMGILPNTTNQADVRLRYKKYVRLAEKWHFASGFSAKTNLSKALPYYVQRGLGYSDFVRGYEFYVLDARQYINWRNNLKLTLLPQRAFDLKVGPPKFTKFYLASYLNLILDAGKVWRQPDPELNSLGKSTLYSFGLGLDIVAYYDNVLRIELMRNHIGETGFFLHFIQSI